MGQYQLVSLFEGSDYSYSLSRASFERLRAWCRRQRCSVLKAVPTTPRLRPRTLLLSIMRSTLNEKLLEYNSRWRQGEDRGCSAGNSGWLEGRQLTDQATMRLILCESIGSSCSLPRARFGKLCMDHFCKCHWPDKRGLLDRGIGQKTCMTWLVREDQPNPKAQFMTQKPCNSREQTSSSTDERWNVVLRYRA